MSNTKRPRENEDSREQNSRKRKSVSSRIQKKNVMRDLIISELSKESLTFQQPKKRPYLPLINNSYHFLKSELICFNIDKSILSETDYKFFRYKKEFNNFYQLIIYIQNFLSDPKTSVDNIYNIPNYDSSYIDSIVKKNIIPETTIENLFEFIEKLRLELQKILNINLLFVIPKEIGTYKSSHSIYEFDIERKTFAIYIGVPQFFVSEPENLSSNDIFFEGILELNLLDKSSSDSQINYSFNLSDSTIQKIMSTKLTIYIPNKNINDDHIIYVNPRDLTLELEVIQISLSETNKKNYLLGVDGNLYDENDHNLVGYAEILDNNNLKVYWGKDYKEKNI